MISVISDLKLKTHIYNCILRFPVEYNMRQTFVFLSSVVLCNVKSKFMVDACWPFLCFSIMKHGAAHPKSRIHFPGTRCISQYIMITIYRDYIVMPMMSWYWALTLAVGPAVL